MEQNVKPSAEENLLYVLIKYKNALIAGAALVVALGAGSFFWVGHQQDNEQQASLELSRIMPYYDQGNIAVAINGDKKVVGLKKIADEYSGRFTGTPSGNMAALLLANAYYNSGDMDRALSAFNAVSINNADLAASAIAGAGDCLFNKNQFEKAAEQYDAASKKTDNKVLKAQYLSHAANCFQQLKQFKKAAELYTTIVDTYPGTTGAAFAQRALWQLAGSL